MEKVNNIRNLKLVYMYQDGNKEVSAATSTTFTVTMPVALSHVYGVYTGGNNAIGCGLGIVNTTGTFRIYAPFKLTKDTWYVSALILGI